MSRMTFIYEHYPGFSDSIYIDFGHVPESVLGEVVIDDDT